jgi:diguanylate cyclase (GGDEF)-like protein
MHADPVAGTVASETAGASPRPRMRVCARAGMRARRALAILALAAPATFLAAVAAAPAAARERAPAGNPASAPAPAQARWALLRTTTFQHWSTDNGLPHPIVTALAQDRTGFVWAGTQDGLARWDGYRFKSYHADPHVAGSLSSGYVDALGTDGAGRLWVGTRDGAVARFDASTDRFVQAEQPPGTHAVPADVTSLIDDGAGGLWVGTTKGLMHVEASAPRADARPTIRPVPAFPAQRGVYALLRDPQGELWAGTNGGFWRCSTPLRDMHCTAIPLPPASRGVEAIVRTADGRLWIGTAGAGAFTHDPVTGRTQAVVESDPAHATLARDTVMTISVAATGEVWIGTVGSGFVVVDPATMSTRHVRHDPRLPQGLASDDVFTSLADRSGQLWLGGTRGLGRTDADASAFTTIFGQTSRTDGLVDPDAPTLLAAADGRLWVGGSDDGIDILDPTRARVRHIGIVPGAAAASAKGPRPKASATAIVQAEDGTVFISSRDGVFRTDGAGKGLRPVPWPEPRRASAQELTIGGGRLWIVAHGGLWSMDLPAKPDAMPVRPPGVEALGDQRFVTLRWDDRQQRLWIGTSDGLVIYDPAARTAERVRSSASDPGSLSGDFVSCIHHDRAGRTWIGTLGGGLNLVVGRDAAGHLRFRRFGAADGLPRPNIGALLEDEQGRIWASTDGGFAVVDPATMTVHSVLRADGAAIMNYWIDAGVNTAHDELVFGGAGGITVIRPRLYRPWDFRPPVVITDARVQGRREAVRADDPAGLTLQPGENAFSVEFAALDFSAPERNRYAYRLAGVDDKWIETDASRRLAAYTNLAPGDYTLEMRGSNRDGAWAGKPTTLAVHILPLWYQTWWARGLAVVALLLALAGIVLLRTRALVLRKRELLALVAERTAALEEKQQELVRANENLARLASFDPLTRCLNRRAFLEQGEVQFRDVVASRSSLFCVMIDIDHFKVFNDRHGHPVGDAVIRSVAGALQRALRSGDLICRYGGEEFCALLAHVDEEGARQLAERIRTRIEQEAGPGVREVGGLQVTVSVGVAARMADTPSLEGLIVQADRALYAAKHAGRNRVALAPGGLVISGPAPAPDALEDNLAPSR